MPSCNVIAGVLKNDWDTLRMVSTAVDGEWGVNQGNTHPKLYLSKYDSTYNVPPKQLAAKLIGRSLVSGPVIVRIATDNGKDGRLFRQGQRCGPYGVLKALVDVRVRHGGNDERRTTESMVQSALRVVCERARKKIQTETETECVCEFQAKYFSFRALFT